MNSQAIYEKKGSKEKSSEDGTLLRDIFVRLKKAEGLAHDTKVAQILGASKATLDQWKARGTIPWKKIYEYSQTNNVSLDWLVNGRGPMRADQCGTAEPGAIYRVQTDQDAVYAIARDVLDALQEADIKLAPASFEQIVRVLHRDMLDRGETSVPYDKIIAIMKIALPEGLLKQ